MLTWMMIVMTTQTMSQGVTTRGKKRPMQQEWSKGKKTAKKMDELTQGLRDYTELCRARLQARQAKASAKKYSKSVTTDD